MVKLSEKVLSVVPSSILLNVVNSSTFLQPCSAGLYAGRSSSACWTGSCDTSSILASSSIMVVDGDYLVMIIIMTLY